MPNPIKTTKKIEAMKVRNNVPLSPSEKPRQRWPFATMKVGGVVDVNDKELWPNASKYAHMIGSRNGWVIRARWLKKENFGRIRRIS